MGMTLTVKLNKTSDSFPVDSYVVQAMTKMAFHSLENGQFMEAHTIARSLLAIRPDNATPHLILAVSCIFRKEPVMAIKIITDKALPLEPNNDLVKAFLGLALRDAGYAAQGSELLTLLSLSKDSEAATMAKELLSQAHQGS